VVRKSAPARSRMAGRDRRLQILEVAAKLYSAQGFRVTTKKIAAAAGVSEAGLYKYFASKKELFAAIIDSQIAQPMAMPVKAANRSDDYEVFYTIAHGILKKLKIQPTFLRTLYFSALESQELSDMVFVSYAEPLHQFLGGYIARRIKEGAFKKVEPEMAVRAFLGMVVNHIISVEFFQKEPVGPKRLDKVAQYFVRLFLDGAQHSKG